MRGVRSFRDLIVWNRSMRLVEKIYRSTDRFPKAELYGLTSQLRRAAVSIPSNIAEGQARATKGEFLQFLGIARGSLAELDTQLELATRLCWLSVEDKASFDTDIDEISRMISGLVSKLRSSSHR